MAKKGIWEMMGKAEGYINELNQYDEETLMALICMVFDTREAEDEDFDTIEALEKMVETAKEVHATMGKMSA